MNIVQRDIIVIGLVVIILMKQCYEIELKNFNE